MIGLKFHTNGLIHPYELNENNFEYKFQAMQKAIDCDCIDIVHAMNLPEPYCMVVDDEGLLKQHPVVNLLASYLYGTHEHGQPIVGDVIILKDKYTPYGIDSVGLDDEDLEILHGILNKNDCVSGMEKVIQKIEEITGRAFNE